MRACASTDAGTGSYERKPPFVRERNFGLPSKKKRWAWLIGLLLGMGWMSTAFGAGGPSNSNNFRLVHPGTLTVAASSTPPSFIVKPDGTVTGIVPSILGGFAEQHHLKIAFQTYSFSGMITAVESGRADVGGAIYYTKQRAKVLLYVQPYGSDGSFLLIKKSTPYESVSSLNGKKVATAAGYAQVPYITKALGNENVIQVSSDPLGVEAVKTGRVYGYITGGEVAWFVHGDSTLRVIKFKAGDLGQPASITSTTDNMFVGCGHSELKKALDEYVNRLRESGQLAALLTKFQEGESIQKTSVNRPDSCGS